MIHLKFFDYVFYRVATSKYYQKVDPKTPYIWAFGVVSLCQLSNILTIIHIYYLFNNSSIENAKSLVWPIAIPLIIVNMFFITTSKKYKYLVDYYKEEKNRKIKGWGVVLYIIISVLAFPCIRLIFF